MCTHQVGPPNWSCIMERDLFYILVPKRDLLCIYFNAHVLVFYTWRVLLQPPSNLDEGKAELIQGDGLGWKAWSGRWFLWQFPISHEENFPIDSTPLDTWVMDLFCHMMKQTLGPTHNRVGQKSYSYWTPSTPLFWQLNRIVCSNDIGTCSIGTERLNQPWVSSTGSVSSVVAIQGTKRFSVMLLLILEENWWVLLLFEFFVGCFFFIYVCSFSGEKEDRSDLWRRQCWAYGFGF